MKKAILGLVLSLVISTSYAHHLVGLGWCSLNKTAVFTTSQFANHLQVQVRVYGTTQILKDFNTPNTGSTNTLFQIPQVNQFQAVKIQFRYRPVGSSGNSNWSAWGDGDGDSNSYTLGNTAAYAGCALLPVKFKSFKVTVLP